MNKPESLTPEEWTDVDRAMGDAWLSIAEHEPLYDLRLLSRAVTALRDQVERVELERDQLEQSAAFWRKLADDLDSQSET